ncbi:alkaline phosphatase-like protein [Ramicandelaber brevisporus]|nr:alkaline phosphatase-like protein [Ramicandelaber brevisporus]
MVSDGFGPASETIARTFIAELKGNSSYVSPLDEILVGSSRTKSSDSLITDSASGATAWTCGSKTYNAAIAVLDDKTRTPCGTVMEAAHKKGLKTGLVTTARITHATPAAWNSHVVDRDFEALIAQQQIGNATLGRVTDLMFGGGACFYQPKSVKGSCRTDERDLFDEAAKKYGWHVKNDRKGFDSIKATDASELPVISLLTPSHMSYDIDRDAAKEPSLKEMAEKAVTLLYEATKNSDKGFLIMIEGARIDMAAHNLDSAGHIRDVLAYWEAAAWVKDFVRKHGDDTVMISVSDHETGGATLGRQVTKEYPPYVFYPTKMQNVTNSTESLSKAILKLNYTTDADGPRQKYLRDTVLPKNLGLTNFTEADVQRIALANDSTLLMDELGNQTSWRMQMGWTTHGHSGVDVNLYSYGRHSHLLRGSHENTDLNKFIAEYLDLDLAPITAAIKNEVTKQAAATPRALFKQKKLSAELTQLFISDLKTHDHGHEN